MKNLRAKSDTINSDGIKIVGDTLLNHSCCVEIVAEHMTRILCVDSFVNKHLNSIKKAARLHDLGKCIQHYQELFRGKKNIPKVLHHEISWVILSALNDLNDENSKHIFYSVYWHHLKPIFNGKTHDNSYAIIKQLTTADLDRIYEFYVFITKSVITKNDFDKKIANIQDNSEQTPNLYTISNNENRINTIYRNIVVGSDQLVSSTDVDLERISASDIDYIESIIRKNKDIIESTYDAFRDDLNELSPRFKQQLDIVDDVINSDSNSVIIKAPAGFGKTLVGLLWSLKSKRKLLWVCPRNIIVDGVFNSIVDELTNLGIQDKVSVEVFLAGKRTQQTNNDIPEYGSDIVITNIDNYLNVITKKRHTYKSYDILYRDVIFDEYHEFISDQLLFGMFDLLMNIRHRIIKCKTLLLSATPSIIEYLWSDDNQPSLILPSKLGHYNAVHNHNYKISLVNDCDVNTDYDSVVINNSIKNSQQLKKDQGCDILLHSDFMDVDKKNNYNELFEEYGKENHILNGKKRVVSAPIIQASMDVSFKHLTEYVLSPETTIQRIGRCDRWGVFGNNGIKSHINLVVNIDDNDTKRSNDGVIKSLYSKTLNQKWIEYLNQYITEQMTLSDFYHIYNSFNSKYYDDIKSYINENLDRSRKQMCVIKPLQWFDKDNISENDITSSSINFRTSVDQRFIIYQIKNTDDFTTQFTEDIVEDSETHYEELLYNARINVPKHIDSLIGKANFTFKKRTNKKHSKFKIRELYQYYAKFKGTPYIALNKEYTREYGLMSK